MSYIQAADDETAYPDTVFAFPPYSTPVRLQRGSSDVRDSSTNI